MRPQIVNPAKPVSERTVSAVEKKFGLRFPDEYRNFLMEFNGGEPRPQAFRRKRSKKYSEVCSHFLGIDNGREYADLKEAFKNLKDKDEPRIPERLAPIAEDPFGNVICISTVGKDLGKIFFWDHEEELAQKRLKSGGVDDAAIDLVADSFEEFLDQFEPPNVKREKRWEKIVLAKDLAGFRKWLDEGGDLKAQNKDMETPLWLATKVGARELIEEALHRGTAVNEVLDAILDNADWELAKWLLKKPEAARFDVKDWHFQQALKSGDADLVKIFLDSGASVEMSLQRGKPLHHAAEGAKDARLIELLLRRGARVGEPNSLGRFALTEAICNGNLEGAKALMDAGEDLYAEPTNGISKQDLEMSAFLDQAEKEGKKTVSADFIKMQRRRIENNRAKAPFFYLQFVKEPRFKKAVIEHARKLGQAER